jgi:mono/diheme cytochrome c family protein
MVVVVAIVIGLGSRFIATPDPTNPTSPTVDSIARGRQAYLNNCAACHGAEARGGGPMAGTTQVPPPALTGPSSHLGVHSDGELFRIIGNGLPGGMPSWAGKLSEREIWDVINFLRSLDGGQQL